MSEFFEKPPLSEAEKHHNLYGDILSLFWHHKYQIYLYQVRNNANFLQKFEYFSEIFYFCRIK